MFEPIDEAFPPVVILREDNEGCEQPVTSSQTQWDLLEVDEGLDSVPAIGVIYGRETIVGPVSVGGREGEGERCEGGRSDGENDWYGGKKMGKWYGRKPERTHQR